MKFFKTMTAAALLLIGTTAMAQGQGRENRQMRSATERAKTETDSMVKSLELNEDQTAKIQVINYTYASKDSIRYDEMRKDREAGKTIDREASMKTMQEQRAAKTTEVKAILTEEQKTKYDELQKQREENRNRQGGQGRQNGATKDTTTNGDK